MLFAAVDIALPSPSGPPTVFDAGTLDWVTAGGIADGIGYVGWYGLTRVILETHVLSAIPARYPSTMTFRYRVNVPSIASISVNDDLLFCAGGAINLPPQYTISGASGIGFPFGGASNSPTGAISRSGQVPILWTAQGRLNPSAFMPPYEINTLIAFQDASAPNPYTKVIPQFSDGVFFLTVVRIVNGSVNGGVLERALNECHGTGGSPVSCSNGGTPIVNSFVQFFTAVADAASPPLALHLPSVFSRPSGGPDPLTGNFGSSVSP